jgi:hypothetical protein
MFLQTACHGLDDELDDDELEDDDELADELEDDDDDAAADDELEDDELDDGASSEFIEAAYSACSVCYSSSRRSRFLSSCTS